MRSALAFRPGARTAGQLLSSLLLVLALGVAFSFQDVQAQAGWSTPIVVFRTDGYTTRPRLVADAAGNLHLFFFLRESSQGGAAGGTMIMYSRLHDGVWSTPVDVLVGAGTNSPTVAVDAQGYLHVVWEGGPQGELLYSQAHVAVAGTARGWTKPAILSEPSAYDSDLLATDDGVLRLVYSTRRGNVWYQQSTDGGGTWSAASTVAETETQGCTTNNPRVAMDSARALHVVWTELQLPSGWPPCGAMYTDSLNQGRSWTTPVRIAGPGYGQINLLATNPSTIFLAWNAMVGIGERKFTRSIDGGFAWAQAQLLTNKLRGGFTGYPALAADSAGVIHVLTSVDRPRGESMAIYHMAWNGTSWSEPVHVSTGAIGFRSVELPWLIVSEGNRLHAVYEDDFQRIWYTTRAVSAPPLPAGDLPAAPRTDAGARRPLEGAEIAVAATPRPDLSGLPAPIDPSVAPRESFLIGLAPAGILVALVILGRVLWRFRG